MPPPPKMANSSTINPTPPRAPAINSLVRKLIAGSPRSRSRPAHRPAGTRARSPSGPRRRRNGPTGRSRPGANRETRPPASRGRPRRRSRPVTPPSRSRQGASTVPRTAPSSPRRSASSSTAAHQAGPAGTPPSRRTPRARPGVTPRAHAAPTSSHPVSPDGCRGRATVAAHRRGSDPPHASRRTVSQPALSRAVTAGRVHAQRGQRDRLAEPGLPLAAGEPLEAQRLAVPPLVVDVLHRPALCERRRAHRDVRGGAVLLTPVGDAADLHRLATRLGDVRGLPPQDDLQVGVLLDRHPQPGPTRVVEEVLDQE